MRWTGEVTDDGCMLIDCPRCGDSGVEPRPVGGAFVEPEWCSHCGGCGYDTFDPMPAIRAIGFAAALTRAFNLGDANGWAARGMVARSEWRRFTWLPNTEGRAA